MRDVQGVAVPEHETEDRDHEQRQVSQEVWVVHIAHEEGPLPRQKSESSQVQPQELQSVSVEKELQDPAPGSLQV